jgi:hypothetical protein
MEICPALGLGDLCLWKLYEINTEDKIIKIQVNRGLIREFRSNFDSSLTFMKYLLKTLFPHALLEEVDNGPIHYPKLTQIKHYDLSHYFSVSLTSPSIPSLYLALHTKARFHNLNFRDYLPQLSVFLENFRCAIPIMILGERTVAKNKETDIWGIFSCYDTIKEALSKQNTVIDNTTEVLNEGSDPAEFEKDLFQIQNAECNVTFGIGGNFLLALFNSKKQIAFTAHEDLSKLPMESPTHLFCRSFDDILGHLEVYRAKP